MTPAVVCDASAAVALLVDAGPDGEWAARTLTGTALWAPGLMRFEAANILRRHELAEQITPGDAAQAHVDLLDLRVEQWPYEAVAARAWELRANLTCYDAAYVALAELLMVPLVTLDRRIRRAPGPTCTVLTPETDPAH